MTEEIGRVRLDYSKYSGEDLYCDGAVENEILDIVKDKTPEEYSELIEKRKSWPLLYHLSPLRENIVDWVPMEPGARVLEVGSGSGAVTGALARKAGSVTCVELSRKRSLINAWRHREQDGITIHVGNFRDIEPDLPRDYDFIFLIGVFEYGESYLGGKTPYEDFLKSLLPHLAEGGRILIAIENKYGLKYFAGCREDHLGTYFSGIEDYGEKKGVRTFGRKGLERIFAACGAEEWSFYYPYPDYKLMTMLYSDSYLPRRGELFDNLRNFDMDRMVVFDEKRAFDGLTEEGLFPIFSNSYLAVIGKGFDIKYVKYSNDRAPEYTIRTEIVCRDGKELAVRKHPIGRAAADHVRGMAVACEKLQERYKGGRLEINRCRLLEENGVPCAQFEFVKGTALSELMDRCLEREDLEGFYRYFEQYLERIGYNSGYPVADFDLIFPNILVEPGGATPEEERWTLIDYEWTFGEAVDMKKLAFRAIHCYLLEDGRRERLDLDRVMEWLGIRAGEAEELRAQEKIFQHFVTGDRRSMGDLRSLIGYRCTFLEGLFREEEAGRIQIFEDRGQDFRVEDSFFADKFMWEDKEGLHLELTVDAGVQRLRIDPASMDCLVRIKELKWNGQKLWEEKGTSAIVPNGIRIEGTDSFVFPTDDPGLEISLQELPFEEENRLELCMERFFVGREMASDIEAVEIKRAEMARRDPRERVQVYEDRGQGFRTEDSFYADSFLQEDEEGLRLELTVEAGVRRLRIDPALADCLVRVRTLKWEGQDLARTGKASAITSNGTRLDDTESFVFPTEDPGFEIALPERPSEGAGKLELCMERIFVEREMASDIETAEIRRAEITEVACEMAREMAWRDPRERVQVYEDRGEGFREEDSFFADSLLREDGEGLHLELTVEAAVKRLRIDPALMDCLVRVRTLKWEGQDLARLGKTSVITSNGTRLDDTDSFVFPTEDPGLEIALPERLPGEAGRFELCLERFFLGRELALDIEQAAKRRLRLL